MIKKLKVIPLSLLAVALCFLVSFADFTDTGDKSREDSTVFPVVRAKAATGDKWEYNVLEDGTAEITGYKGKNPKIRIPGTIDGKKVIGIGEKAFFEDEDGQKPPYDTLKSVKIPSGITYIGKMAFSGCTKLTEIKIPSGVTGIGDSAFSECSGLKSVEIPSGVTSIGYGAFLGCSLESIHIPASVASIGEDALLCASLSRITVEEGNAVYDSRDNCNALIETATATLLAGSSNTKIPEGISKIGNSAFRSRKITEIEIPSSVVSIGECAFLGCRYLRSITIPSSVTNIGQGAFGFCTILKSADIPAGITTIDECVFDNCLALKSITIPSSVTSIGNSAFRECNSLSSIVIPASVTHIDGSAFLCCKNINRIAVEEGNTVYDSRGECNAIIETATDTLMMGCISTVIPDGVVSIGHGAFFNCNDLKSIVIPSSVEKIDNLAFSGCMNLKKITVKSKKLKFVGDHALEGIEKKAVIKVPKGKVKAYKKLLVMKDTGYLRTMKVK